MLSRSESGNRGNGKRKQAEGPHSIGSEWHRRGSPRVAEAGQLADQWSPLIVGQLRANLPALVTPLHPPRSASGRRATALHARPLSRPHRRSTRSPQLALSHERSPVEVQLFAPHGECCFKHEVGSYKQVDGVEILGPDEGNDAAQLLVFPSIPEHFAKSFLRKSFSHQVGPNA
jgi:hypothetical protein